MVENTLLETSQVLRELDRRLALDFRSTESSQPRMTELNLSDTPPLTAPDTHTPNHQNAGTSRNLQTTKEQPGSLDQIADLLLGLRYDQMIELCDAIWNGHAANSPLAQEGLPLLLHRWAKSHASAVRKAKKQPE
jgi:hypothetical protein